MRYGEALERLLQLRRFGVRPGLEQTRAILTALGEPQQGLAYLHVGGTNGKGSTAAIAERVWRADGRRTGLYTSPHLSRFTERIRIGGAELGEDETAALTERVLAVAPAEATFFEVVTAMALCAFVERGVEVAVIEVGLGGRLDSTNALGPPLAAVVTSIALEHTEVLGDTVAAIAGEKAGIFKRGAPALIGAVDEAARAVLTATAAAVGAPLAVLGTDFAATLDEGVLRYRGPGGALVAPFALRGAHQAGNAALALAALGSVAAPYRPSQAARIEGLAAVRWPARLELLAPDLLVDAAHNPEGARSLAAALPSLRAGRPVTLVIGVVSDKDAAGMAAALRPLADAVVLTTVPSPRAADPEELAALWPGATIEPSLPAALALARARGGLTVATGSIFLAGAVRSLVLGERADEIAVQDPAPSAPQKL